MPTKDAIIKAQSRVLSAFRAVHAIALLEMVMLGVDGNKLYTFYKSDHISTIAQQADDEYMDALAELEQAQQDVTKGE